MGNRVTPAFAQVVYQTVITLTASDQLSAAFAAQTRWIRLGVGGFTTALNGGVKYAVGDGSPTVATVYAALPASGYEYIAVNPGQKVCVRALNADANVLCSITELA